MYKIKMIIQKIQAEFLQGQIYNAVKKSFIKNGARFGADEWDDTSGLFVTYDEIENDEFMLSKEVHNDGDLETMFTPADIIYTLKYKKENITMPRAKLKSLFDFAMKNREYIENYNNHLVDTLNSSMKKLKQR